MPIAARTDGLGYDEEMDVFHDISNSVVAIVPKCGRSKPSTPSYLSAWPQRGGKL
jgi:hypothetical protein